MLGLPLLAFALLLPNAALESEALADSTASARRIAEWRASETGFPGIGLPKFLRFHRKRGTEVEVNVMKTRLRELVAQQEAFYAKNSTYTRNVNKLAPTVSLKDSVSNGVQIEILFASSKGWSAVASHLNAPGRSCVAFVGHEESIPVMPRTRLEGNSATVEGLPVCDLK